jgi:hypothetical protein
MNLRKGFSHQFKSKCQISNLLMKKFKYLDLPQYLFINMISYCCKQKFLYRFFIINMTRNISETNVINCYWMKLCNMVKILTCLVCCVNCICHVLHKKRSSSTPQHEVTFYRGHRLHGVVMRYKAIFPQISENFIKYTMKTKIYKYKMKLGYTCTEILFSVEISNQISIRFHFLVKVSFQ